MDALAQEDNISDLKAALSRLPETINKTYEEALERIQNQGSRRAERGNEVLMWITFAQRPLTVSELLVALAIRRGDRNLDEDRIPQKEMLLSACCGLVVIDEESQIIRLVHYTTEEYFSSVRQTRFPNGHQTIAEALLTYLSFAIFDAGTDGPSELDVDIEYYSHVAKYCETLIAENSLLAYTTEEWGFHVQEALQLGLLNTKADSTASSRDFQDTIDAFLELAGNATTYIRIKHYLRPIWGHRRNPEAPKSVPRLVLAAWAGVSLLVQSYIEKGVNVNGTDSRGFTAMHYAAADNHVQIVRLLLNQHVQLHDGSREKKTALHLAIVAGHQAVVRMLVEKKPLATAKATLDALGTAAQAGNEGISQIVMAQAMTHVASKELRSALPQQVLWWAIYTGQEQLVQFALTHAFDSDIAEGHLTRCLAEAASRGNLRIMAMLLDRGVDANRPVKGRYDDRYHLPLHIAILEGKVDAVQLLLERGAVPNLIDRDGNWPVHFVVRSRGHGQASMLRLLFDYGARVNVLNNKYETPLLVLSKSHRERHLFSEPVTRILLDKGADIAVTDGAYGRTALEWAVLMGNEPLVGLLLDHSAHQLPKALLILLTKLYYALDAGKEEEIQSLLQNELISNLQSISKLLLLDKPARVGQAAVVQLFLDMGADTEAKEHCANTALYVASSNKHPSVVKLLLEHGANVEAKDRHGYTALCKASSEGDPSVVKLLLEHGANVEAKDRHGYTALCKASSEGDPSVVKLLLEYGATIEVKNIYAENALHMASRNENPAVVKLLLEHGANIETKDGIGKTALHRASTFGCLSVVELLLEHGASIETKALNGENVLHAGSEGFDPKADVIIKLLLEHGANSDVLSDNGVTPLMEAISSNNYAVAKLLAENGASLNTVSNHQFSTKTALGTAIREKYEPMVRLLLQHGADMKLSDVHCGGLLHVAVRAGCRKSMIKLLLDNGADLEALDSRGYTPLVTAVRKGMLSIVGTLLERGANPVGVLSALQDQDKVLGPSTRVSEGDFEEVVELVRQAERKLQPDHLSPMAELAQHRV